jgi:hypothetical protein
MILGRLPAWVQQRELKEWQNTGQIMVPNCVDCNRIAENILAVWQYRIDSRSSIAWLPVLSFACASMISSRFTSTDRPFHCLDDI